MCIRGAGRCTADLLRSRTLSLTFFGKLKRLGRGGLNSVEITGICGLDPNDQERVEWPERDVVLGVLRLMERDGEVYNENEAGPGSWWLGSG